MTKHSEKPIEGGASDRVLSDPEFQAVVKHFLTTPPAPHDSEKAVHGNSARKPKLKTQKETS
ncbi:MAG: hypothetical protein ACLQUZ_01295 [Rhizomicrobium sp.]